MRKNRVYTIDELITRAGKRLITNVMYQLKYVKPRGRARNIPGGWIQRYF